MAGRYTTYAELKQRAFQLADLMNSSFISDNECQNIFEDTYRQIYADLIFIGDKFYLKRQDVYRGENTLPPNFYSLEGLYGIKANSVTPILRRAETQALNSCTYEIIDDKLIIYAREFFERMEMRYYPEPDSLFNSNGGTVGDLTPITDMPSNIFHTYLCYKVAVQLKIKQGADPTGLSALANEMWETYLQTLNRDNFGMPRVQNVYSVRRW
jgi:hypothetical protein